jgi:Inner membrane component of T3SS, cytoplasmic domain
MAAGDAFRRNDDDDIENRKTRRMDEREARPAGGRDPFTQRYGPARRQGDQPPPEPRDYMDNPVVGWLVIVTGPGRGRSFELRYGRNRIGRDDGQDVSLNFGDEQISRASHAVLSFDPEATRFFIEPGEGSNLTYLNDRAVIGAEPIASGDSIRCGTTCLAFVAFCGPDFNW